MLTGALGRVLAPRAACLHMAHLLDLLPLGQMRERPTPGPQTPLVYNCSRRNTYRGFHHSEGSPHGSQAQVT